jgi:hypothetical protein
MRFEAPKSLLLQEVSSFTRTFGTIIAPLVILFFIVLVVSEILSVLKHSKYPTQTVARSSQAIWRCLCSPYLCRVSVAVGVKDKFWP